MNPKARHNAREFALQALYQWQISQTPANEVATHFLTTQIKKKNVDLDYFKELIITVPAEHLTLDQHMIPFLDRAITELDPIELSILRLSIYELTNRPDIPYRVVINEALELTKKFGSTDGYKFVNGILDKVSKKIRVVEMHAERKA